MKKAFTLAEVLITLMIIGIVAALTIPSVISNYQQQEFKTGLKKAVSVLNEAIQMNISQDGETPYDRGECSKYGNNTDRQKTNLKLMDYLKRHMNVVKTEIGTHLVQEVVSDNVKFWSSRNSAFYTADGMRFEFIEGSMLANHLRDNPIKLHESDVQLNSHYVELCGSYGLANNPNNTIEPPCYILVDVNGDRKPTVYGANAVLMDENGSVKKNYIYPSPGDKKLTDIFPILITDEKAIPFGVVAQRAMYSK